MTTEDAKTYLSNRDIPRLFESLMTGLMYHRPQNHIKYLIDCLQKVHDKGQDNITWSSFVDIRRTKTPLPPISNGTSRPASKGSRPSSKTKAPKDTLVNSDVSPDEVDISNQSLKSVSPPTVIPNNDLSWEEEKPQEKSSSPLPAIPTSTTTTTAAPQKINLPDIPVAVVMGAPGSGKDVAVEKILQNYPDWKLFNVNKLIKSEIQRRGDAHSKWKLTKDLMSRGEVAPEEVTSEMLLEGLKNLSSSAKGIVITSFPKNMQHVEEYSKFVSRLDVVFMIDCDEAKAMDRMLRKARNSSKPEHSMSAITTKLNYFKAQTLAAAKFYDDQGKLVVIDGDKDEAQTCYEFGTAFDELFFSKYGTKRTEAPRATSASSVPDPATYKKKSQEREESFLAEEEVKPLFTGAVPPPAVISEQDTGRKPGLPTAPIIFVAGGPGSGKGTQCKRILERYEGFVHLSMGDIIRTEISNKGTADDKWGMITQLMSKGEMAPEDVTIDLLKEQLNKHSSAKAFIIEGFPRDKSQVESFNKTIGGLNFVILFDCEEYYMQMRLLKRGRDSGRPDDNPSAIANRLNFYKHNTLPVMKHFDDAGKLVVLDTDRDMETIFFEISQMFDFAFFGRKPGDNTLKHNSNDKLPTHIDDTSKAALQIKAAFEGGKNRQRKVLSRGASYSTKYESSSQREDTNLSNVSVISNKQAEKKQTGSNNTSTEKAKDHITAAFRGFALRQSHKQKQNVNETPSDEESKAAAERIQAGFRGFQARKKLQLEKQQQQDKKQESETAPVQEEVIEASISQDTANTTGETVENPEHTKTLDEAAKS